VSYPLPGTRFYEKVKAQLGEKTHWRDSGDLSMMFRGTYDSAFYRCIRDLLHDQVTLQQSAASDSKGDYSDAFAALDAQWAALIASEHLHRNRDATAVPPEPRDHVVPLRRVAAAQNR
jgi:anaerobic magnesium-protoporphyrin IX monomethyl ester cyclase